MIPATAGKRNDLQATLRTNKSFIADCEPFGHPPPSLSSSCFSYQRATGRQGRQWRNRLTAAFINHPETTPSMPADTINTTAVRRTREEYKVR